MVAPVQLARHPGDFGSVPEDQYPVHQAAVAAGAVQAAAQQETAEQRQLGGEDQTDQQVPAGEVGLEHIGQQRNPGSQMHTGLEDQLVLGVPDEESFPLIGMGQREHAHPQSRYQRGKNEIPGRVSRTLETQLESHQGSHDGGPEINRQKRPDVMRLPHPSVGESTRGVVRSGFHRGQALPPAVPTPIRHVFVRSKPRRGIRGPRRIESEVQAVNAPGPKVNRTGTPGREGVSANFGGHTGPARPVDRTRR